MAAQEEDKRREEVRIQQIIHQHNRNLQNLGINTTLTLTSTTSNTSNTSTAATAATAATASNPATAATTSKSPSQAQPNPES